MCPVVAQSTRCRGHRACFVLGRHCSALPTRSDSDDPFHGISDGGSGSPGIFAESDVDVDAPLKPKLYGGNALRRQHDGTVRGMLQHFGVPWSRGLELVTRQVHGDVDLAVSVGCLSVTGRVMCLANKRHGRDIT